MARSSQPARLFWIWLGWGWLGFAAAAVIYRASTQSLTIDEGYVFKDFLQPDASNLFRSYSASYHVLHTWASWISVHLFGISELSVRLPSVLAGLLYLAGVGRFCGRWLTGGGRFFCGVVFLSANPFIADYLSAARGYGAALAFFLWGFECLLGRQLLNQEDHRLKPVPLYRAGIFFALSVCCNLTFVAPVVATAAIFIAARREPLRLAIRQFAIPFLAVSVSILAIPLFHAERAAFYFGSDTLAESIRTLIDPSFFHGGGPLPIWSTVATAVLAGLAILGAAATLRSRAFALKLASGSLALSFLILIAAHLILGVPYPWSRTGLYLILLFEVMCLLDWEHETSKGLAGVFGAACAIGAGLFVAQFDARFYYDFRDDADMSQVMRRLGTLHRSGRACVGGTWTFEHTVYYYRTRYGFDWLDEMTRTPTPQPGCPYFILSAADRSFVDSLSLRVEWTGPVSGAILAQAK